MTGNRLLKALHSTKHVAGLTHNFYRYPARMSPELAHEVIQLFSQPDDVVLEPFMGGGTTIVEAVAAGRFAVGIDLNPVALFVTAARTTPLSSNDYSTLRRWADSLTPSKLHSSENVELDTRTKNLPEPMQQMFSLMLDELYSLSLPRQRSFARCVLLRLGQWAVDCKSTLPDEVAAYEKLRLFLDEMLNGLNDLAVAAHSQGVAKNKITSRRKLILRSIANAQNDRRLSETCGKPKLVLTSPPYPGVHVLYHRWQVSGRRETPAPYWLIDAQDGNGASYYTLGSRSKLGLKNYFEGITEAFRSVRALMHPEGLAVQLVAFSDVESQLPAYLEAMELAGYTEDKTITAGYTELWRNVPNRKWYNQLGKARNAGQELLLFHRPRLDT